jgi:hypothetical protein
MSQVAVGDTTASPPRADVEPSALQGEGISSRIWLLCASTLILFALALRLVGIDQQSAFMDEASNILAGRMLIEQHTVYADLLNWAYEWYLWPVLAGFADEFGGLAFVRSVTAMCSVIMVIATSVAAARLAPRDLNQDLRWAVALLAGAIMAVAPTAIGVGRFGTYDALAGATVMLGVTLILGRRESEVPRWQLLAAAMLLFGAFLSKYLVAVYFPFVCVYVVARHGTRVRAAARDAAWFVLPLSGACAIYLVVFLTPLSALLDTSLHYGDLKSADPLREYVLNRPELVLLLLAAACGWRFASWHGRAVGAGGAAVIVGFQILARPDFDFWKHSIYLLYFLAPLAALTGLRLPFRSGTARVVSALAAVGFGVVLWSPALAAADRLVDFYPNLNPSLVPIRQAVAGSAVLLTDDTALRYYLYPGMSTDRVFGPFNFDYQGLYGPAAYQRAIADRYFDAVVLDGVVTPQGGSFRDELGPQFDTVYQPVYSRDDGGFDLEVYKPVRPDGPIPRDDNQLSWPVALTFDTGTDGWGAHPDAGDWGESQQIEEAMTPAWNGHAALEFTPAPDSEIVSLRRSGHITRLRARILVTSSDPSGAPLHVGFIAFDSNWQWHDDGFRWVVPPNSWTTISWDLANPDNYEEVGLKVPDGVSQAYIGSFEIQP